MSYQALARTHRPQNFSEVIGQTATVTALKNSLDNQTLHHAYLFTGTRGVGKTSLARIMAQALNCEQGISSTPCGQCAHCQAIQASQFIDLIEIDAASHTKVEDIRALLDNIPYRPTQGRYKIYLIDEVHMLSNHSFNALLVTLEEPPPYVIFLLATTDPQKLPATILSRCLRFHLHHLSTHDISHHLANIVAARNMSADETALSQIAHAADGSVRDALSLLDQALALSNNHVTQQSIQDMLGNIDQDTLETLMLALAKKETEQVLSISQSLQHQGANFAHTLQQMLAMVHQAAMAHHSQANKLPAICQHLSPQDTQLFYQILLHGQRDLGLAPSPLMGFEMTLLRLLDFYPLETQTPASNHTTGDPVSTVDAPSTPPCQAAKPKMLTWNNTFIDQLNLTGVTLALAKHCVLTHQKATHWHFSLDNNYQSLLNKKRLDNIQLALQKHLKQADLQVEINIQNCVDHSQTPVEQAKEQHSQRQEAVQKKIEKDPITQKLMDTFDATIIASQTTEQDALI